MVNVHLFFKPSETFSNLCNDAWEPCVCVCVLSFAGSHDSMSYDLDKNSPIIEPDGLKKFSKLCCVRKTVRRWATTQVIPE